DEIAFAPDGERVHRLLALQIAELRVHDLPLAQVDLARSAAILEREHAGLAGHRHQLDDVGQRQFTQRTLECHRRSSSLCGSQVPRAARGYASQTVARQKVMVSRAKNGGQETRLAGGPGRALFLGYSARRVIAAAKRPRCAAQMAIASASAASDASGV